MIVVFKSLDLFLAKSTRDVLISQPVGQHQHAPTTVGESRIHHEKSLISFRKTDEFSVYLLDRSCG